MPSAIDPSDRKLLLVAGAVMLVLAAALAVVSPPPAEQGGGTPSIYSDASGGAHAAFLLLQEVASQRTCVGTASDGSSAGFRRRDPDSREPGRDSQQSGKGSSAAIRGIGRTNYFHRPARWRLLLGRRLLGRASRETLGHVSSQSSEQLHAPRRENFFAEAE